MMRGLRFLAWARSPLRAEIGAGRVKGRVISFGNYPSIVEEETIFERGAKGGFRTRERERFLAKELLNRNDSPLVGCPSSN